MPKLANPGKPLPVTLQDVSLLARVLLGVAPDQRPQKLAQTLQAAQQANEFVQITGRAHPMWGDGRIGTAALRFKCLREPVSMTQDYASCLNLVLQYVISDKRQP